MYTRDFDATTGPEALVLGDDILLSFEVFDDDLVVDDDGAYVSGTPHDITGWTFAFFVRKTDKAPGTPLISKTSGSGIAITGTFDAAHEDNTQRVEVSIADTDTVLDDGSIVVPPGKYRHSLKRTNAGSEKTVADGKFVLLERPVRT
jgi:hypothetical protein